MAMEIPAELKSLASRLHSADTPAEYFTYFLAALDEVNEYQRKRGKGESYLVQVSWFPARVNPVEYYKLFEFMKNLHLVGLGFLCPTADQVMAWMKAGYIAGL